MHIVTITITIIISVVAISITTFTCGCDYIRERVVRISIIFLDISPIITSSGSTHYVSLYPMTTTTATTTSITPTASANRIASDHHQVLCLAVIAVILLNHITIVIGVCVLILAIVTITITPVRSGDLTPRN